MTSSQSVPPQLRLIGDPVLHSSGKDFPLSPTQADITELEHQVAIAKQLLIDTGGIGIAANQCADITNPYRFAIVGIYHEVAEHVAQTQQRYPGLIFPQAKLIINPQVVMRSKEMQPFRHGCLSIPGGIRAEIMTPKTITLSYLGYDHDHFNHQEETYVDVAAVILQHELNHINGGLTYFDCCLAALDVKNKTLMADVLEQTVVYLGHVDLHTSHANMPPAFYRIVSIDEHGHSIFHPDILKQALTEHPHLVTCLGLQQRLRLHQMPD